MYVRMYVGRTKDVRTEEVVRHAGSEQRMVIARGLLFITGVSTSVIPSVRQSIQPSRRFVLQGTTS